MELNKVLRLYTQINDQASWDMLVKNYLKSIMPSPLTSLDSTIYWITSGLSELVVSKLNHSLPVRPFLSSSLEMRPFPSESSALKTLMRFSYLKTTEFSRQQAMN